MDSSSSDNSNSLWARLIKEPHVETFKDPMLLLDRWLVSFDPDQQSFIKDRLGPILNLPKVQVPFNMFRALVHLWKPDEVAFRLGQHVLSPTIEEYARLLQAPPTSEGIYVPSFTHGPIRIISEFLGLKREAVIEAMKGCNEFSIRLTTLMDWFGNLDNYISHRNSFTVSIVTWNENRVNAFIVAAFATILFPHGNLFIHFRVFELVAQYLTGKSYVPALLAEQIRSLNHIKIKGRGSFKASMHLLMVWFASHTKFYGKGLANGSLIRPSYDLIQSFVERVRMEDNEPFWSILAIFEDMEPQDFIWQARWFKCPAAILGCKNYLTVPLIGITGCTGYYPSSVIRQYGMLQDITIKPELGRVVLDYMDPTLTQIAKQSKLTLIKAIWDDREIKPVFEVEPESKLTRDYRATRWYIANQMKKNKDIQYEAPDILEPAPPEPDPEMIAYMEMVSARLEVCHRDYVERDREMIDRLNEAHNRIVLLESELKQARKRTQLLEDKIICPAKTRRLV